MDDRLDALERLARLRDSGLLTPAELDAEKARILQGGTETAPSPEAPVVKPAADAEAAPGPWQRHKWLFAGTGGGVLLTAFLLYIVLVRPPRERDEARSAAEAPPVQQASNVAAPVQEPTPTGADLADLFDGPPGTCAFGNRLRTAVGEFGPTPRTRQVSVTGLVAPVTARAAELHAEGVPATALVMELPVSGQWRGLQVTGVRLVTWRGASINSVQVKFAGTAERVRRLLNNAGFRLPETGQMRPFESGTSDGAIGVEALSNGTGLTCTLAQPAAARTGAVAAPAAR